MAGRSGYRHVGHESEHDSIEVDILSPHGSPHARSVATSRAVDLELVSPPQPAGRQLQLNSLEPALLEEDMRHVSPISHVMSEPLCRKKYLRFLIEFAILILALVLAYLLGVHSASRSSDESGDSGASSRPAPVILVSFDGFRADYLDLAGAAATPNFHALRTDRHAIYANGMRPAFPSYTFPNHYTLVTGMVTEHHGIVGNHIFDPTTNASFSYTNPTAIHESVWWKAQTIWGLAEMYNITTGAVFWVGSETLIEGHRPNVWLHYDESITPLQRVEQIFEWIDNGECTLCLIYFSDVDAAGHEYGAASPEVLSAVSRMDAIVGEIESRLASRQLTDTASLVLLADHGMATVEHQIFLDDYIDLSPERGLTHEDQGAFLNIWLPRPIDAQLQAEVLRNLSGVAHITCWAKDEMPGSNHYQASVRIAPINCLCDVGYVTSARSSSSSWSFPSTVKGVHGYSPESAEMHALFMARAPSYFDSDVDNQAGVIEEIANLNIFNLMCHLLRISPSPNNGTLTDFAPFLTNIPRLL